MDLAPYVENLCRELAVAAAAGGAEARALGERLAAQLESAARLTLLNVLSDAMDEVTRELAPGSVDVRLRGLDPEFVVAAPPVRDDSGAVRAPMAPVVPEGVGEGAASRINFRPPARLKARIEQAANREGLSVNSWLVRAVAAVPELSDDQRGARAGDLGR
ncbi:hypothetical protein [Streptomyces sp. NBC_01465]|uniref:hypothetical protein n=1 Tax=Streptomyces sp. NBC_01465 TaxID=2903878 RepID=UPI002E32E017|nr:hypothetical protein [Streptomyces sp. NBC_01465]